MRVQVVPKLGGLMSEIQVGVKLKEGPLQDIFMGFQPGKLQEDLGVSERLTFTAADFFFWKGFSLLKKFSSAETLKLLMKMLKTTRDKTCKWIRFTVRIP